MMMPLFHRGVARTRGIVAMALAAGALLAAQPALADISPIIVRIEAISSQGSGVWTARLEQGEFGPGGTYHWMLDGPADIQTPGGEVLATLTEGELSIIEDPQVHIAFSVQAGAADTVFQISTALLSFPTLNPAEGSADGSITASDVNGNGVSLTGLHSGSMLTAQYNGFVPTGTVFADLIPGPLSSPDPFGSVSSSHTTPLSGFTAIPDPVSDISMQYFFSLSAHDIASGTATFVVIPAPGAVAGLLGAAAVAGWRRRRS